MSSAIVPVKSPVVSSFAFGDIELRAVLINDIPWFVLADACTALGIRLDNALSGLDGDEKLPYTVGQPGLSDISVFLVSEFGLYSLILRSRKAEAARFKRWVTHEVLPSIRRTGHYGVAQLSRRELAQMVIEAEDRAAAAHAEIERAAPKVNYVDHFVNPTIDAVHLGAFAAELGVPVNRLRTYLNVKRLIFRDKGTGSWRYYSSDRGRAWFVVRAHHEVEHRGPNGQVPTTLYVTPVGKEGIRRMLERDPIG